ncbi:MAG TPA: hypothetical protein VFD22_04695, partial [Gemmatimonadaceae bacterium]|nr:hypothetical protein [Gemmatimonadaceae bacterium]
VASQWKPDMNPDSLANTAGRALARRVTLVDSTGVVVGDSEFDGSDLQRLSNHLYRPEVMQASRSGVGIARRISSSKGDQELYVAARAGSGFARVSVSTGVIDALFDRARRDILITGLVALVEFRIPDHNARRIDQRHSSCERTAGCIRERVRIHVRLPLRCDESGFSLEAGFALNRNA